MKKLVIFDLDDTLRHDGFDDCNCTLGYGLHLCEEIESILKYLQEKGHVLAVASHNFEALSILTTLNVHSYFDIIVGECESADTKIPLVNKILKHTNMAKNDIIFFDDLREITDDLKRNGIIAKMINWRYGVRMKDILECGL